MDGIKIGYTRVATDEHDLPAERKALLGLGVEPNRLFIDRGLTDANRPRPGLREAMAASRADDILVVTKLHRLARSISDAADIGNTLAAKRISLSLSGTLYDPADRTGRIFFDTLELAAEFEGDMMRMRTREGLALAKAKGRLRGGQPQLTALQQRHLLELHDAGEHNQAEIAHLLGISRTTVYGTIQRRGPDTVSPASSH
ncbi:recombinase family protein [Rathayibacter soli]|uniref:recombinase family protein n=1 Tax=Rathayibacter soli TaxID=3144168 RepID=UPI0027E4F772|nr:recombinase family protein [Glaciibacter superstes]